MHAHIDAFTKLATIVGEYEALGEVVLVDSGDRVTGNAYVDDAAQPGMPIIELMNSVGYDVVTCGNHEFDKGSAVVRQMVDGSDFEWVCANIKAPEGFDIKPYTTLTVDGVELGFVGIVATDGGGRPLGRAQSYVDFSFTTDEDAAYEACATLAPQCDFVVLLSHMGYKMDTKLAERGIACDWIAGGHSHDTANLEVGEVQLSQNRKEIRYVTIADLTVEDGQIQSVEYKQVNMADVEADAATAELVAEIKARDPELNTVEGVVNVAATQVGIANFTIDALLSYPYEGGFEPEIVFYHIGGVRLSELPAGDIKRVTILNNDPFVSTVALGTLTPDEIKAGGFDAYFVDHGTGIYPCSAAGVPFSAAAIASKGDALADITEDLAAEQKARVVYDNILRLSDDPDVNDAIRFLRQREIVHFQRFGEAMNILRDKNF
jgi:5'-nucleotidase